MHEGDERSFRRYFSKYQCVIVAGSSSFPATITDYSLTGFSLTVDGNPLLKTGEVFEIRDFPVCSRGKVLSTEDHGSSLRVDASRLEPFSGNLTHFKLSDILIDLQRSLKTGVLRVIRGSAVKTVLIKGGDIIFAASNLNDDRLGDMLLRQGRISQGDFDESVRIMTAHGIKQGAALARIGCIKPGDLAQIVKDQVEMIIESTFGWNDADFEFVERDIPSHEVVTLKLSAANIIFRGIRRFADFKRMTSEYPPERIVVFSSSPLDLFQDIDFDKTEKKILSLVDGNITIGDFSHFFSHDDIEILRRIYALIEIRMLEIVIDCAEPQGSFFREVFEEKESVTGRSLLQEIDELHSSYTGGMSHYQILGLSPSAADADIKRAYYAAAKKFHPDRHFALTGDVKSKLHDLFAGITEAYTILKDPVQRREYDRKRGSKTPSKDVSNQRKAEESFQKGLDLFNRGRVDDAIKMFAQSAYLDEKVAAYHYHLGISYQKTGKHKDAKKSLERALQIDPENPDIHAELGHVLLKLGLGLRSRGSFDRALKRRPDCARAIEGKHLLNERAT